MLGIIVAIVIGIFSPNPVAGKRVYDGAALLDSEIASQLESEIHEIELKTTAEVAVVTVSSLEGKTIEEYANELYNRWGLGKQDTNNGVLFLVALNERRARIEVGYGLEPLITDSKAGLILDRDVIPEFKKGDYSLGIQQGTFSILMLLRNNPEQARGISGSLPKFLNFSRNNEKTLMLIGYGVVAFSFVLAYFARKKRTYGPLVFTSLFIALGGLVLWLGLTLWNARHSNNFPLSFSGPVGLGLIALVTNVRRFLRFKPHKCKKCGTHLSLLTEKDDDRKLDEAQKLEEQLGSVDYDVWICKACLTSDVEAYTNWFSNFGTCPNCKHKTFAEKSTVLQPATTYSTGRTKVEGECKSCWHKTSRIDIIPRIQRSSSSSSSSSGGGGGGSFGGGSSGGGGASRGW